MKLVIELIIFVGICVILNYFLKRKKFFELASKIPGPREHIPLIGVLPEFIGADLKKIFKIVLKYENRFRGISKVWFGPELIIVINTPEAMQKVLNSKECLDKPKFFKCFRLQQASLFGSLEAWRSHRKILNPAFSICVLKSFIPLFDSNSKKLINALRTHSDNCEDDDAVMNEFDVFPHMSAFFLETILQAALDLDVDILNNEKKDEYLKYYDEFLFAITTRMTRFWLHFDPIYNMTKYFKMEMEARKKSSLKFTEYVLKKGRLNSDLDNNHKNVPKNTIKSLVNPKHALSDQEIREEINSIIMAGQETSAITVSTVILMLAMFKDIQNKVVDELRAFMNDTIDFDTLNQLPYLEMVIKETMRLFPVAAFTLRTTTDEFELNKYTIPAGANLFLSIYTLHRDKMLWGDDAELFIPERFEVEKIKHIHPYAYVPFTGGPRICLGWRYAMFFMKTCLANFLRNYEVDTSLKFNDLELEVSITLKICQGYKIRLKKRNF